MRRTRGRAAIADTVLGRFFTPAFVERAGADVHTVRRTLLQVDPVGYTGCCAAIRDMDLRPGLARIHAPVLVVTCSGDQSLPPAMGEAVATVIGDARVVELALAHIPHFEAPERFVELVVDFCLPGPADRRPADRDPTNRGS